MKLLVTGARGQLGQDLLALAVHGAVNAAGVHVDFDVVGTDVSDLDLTDGPAVLDFVGAQRPDVVIHGAAYTAVDAAETNEELAHAVNVVGSGHVAAAAAAVGAGVVAVSTDYVFPGDAATPYEPGDPTGPRSAYGRTKLAGELAVRALLPDASWIVRTAWVWGAGGANFVKTMARLEASRDTISVVDDQRGSPTWSRDLAAGLLALAASTATVAPGTYHATGGGETTWCGFARAIFSELGADPSRVAATTSDAYPSVAARPAYSVLSPAAWVGAGLPPLQNWRSALAEAFADPQVAAALRG